MTPGPDAAVGERPAAVGGEPGPSYVRRARAACVASGGRWTEGTYPRSSGGVAAFVLLEPRQAPARGLVLVAHATGNDKFFPMLRLHGALLAQGYAVFAFDLDGHGRGSSHVLTLASVDSMLPEALAEARRRMPPLPCYLVGQSLGALLIVRSLQRRGLEGVTATVLLAPPLAGAVAARQPWQELLSVLRPSAWRAALDYGGWGVLPALGPFKRHEYPLRLAAADGQPNPRPSLTSYVAMVDQLTAALPADAAAALGCPTLLLYGSRDGVTPGAQATAFAAQLSSPSTLALVTGETHFTLPLSQAAIKQVTQWLAAYP